MKAQGLPWVLFVLLLVVSVAFAAEELTVEIERLPEDPGKSIRLGEIARISGPDDLAAQARDVTVKIREGFLWRSDVVAALVNQGIGGVTLRLLMPPKIAIREGDVVPDLEALVLKLSGWQGSVKVRSSAAAPRGELLAPLKLRPGAATALLRIRTQDGTREVPISMEWFQNVVMTRRIVENGTVLSQEDVEVRQVRISSPMDAVSDIRQAVGRMTNRRLPAGERISPGFLLTPPIVHRGDSVFIVVRKGALVLRMQGEAMEDGAAGETIRVRNGQSKKIIEAVIRSKDEVEVRIP